MDHTNTYIVTHQVAGRHDIPEAYFLEEGTRTLMYADIFKSISFVCAFLLYIFVYNSNT